MKSAKKIIFGISLLFTFLFLSSSAMAVTINYSTTELGAGEDLWQIDYTISDYDAAVYAGFDIYFDYGDYENITLISSEADWSPLVIQPELIWGEEDPGMLDAESIAESGLLTASFSVTVTWLGQGSISSQDFELYASDYTVLYSGTATPVPVPSSFALLFSGLAGALVLRKKN